VTPYTPEPLNSFTDMRAIARQEAIAALQNQSLLSSMVPGSLPQNAVITPFVTALPVTANNGDEIRFLADDTLGIVWHLRYRSSAPSKYRWEYLGGHGLYDETTTSETTASASYANLSGGATGPSLTLPVKGDYRIEFGCFSTGTNGTAQQWMAIDLNGAGAADAEGIKLQPPDATFYCAGQSSRLMEREATAASFTLVSKYKTNAGTATFENRWLLATPIRVGRS
jgi:hypothetical protein